MTEFLEAFAAALGEPELAPEGELAGRLLALAKVVADGTGDRINAPLSTYLAGRYVARNASGRDAAVALDHVAAAARDLLDGRP